MAERKENIFKNFGPSPVRDHTESPEVIEQGVVDPKILERIQKAERGELKARFASILDRGIVADRLHVDVPDDIHYEWVRNDPLEINRLEALGFKVDNEYANKRAIHSDGSNSAIVGDVICMTCPKEYKKLIDEIREEQSIKQHMKRTVKGKDINREEEEFFNDVATSSDKVVAYSSSQERSITKNTLADVIASIDSQVKKAD